MKQTHKRRSAGRASAGQASTKRGRRLPPDEREQLIVREAVRFFAEVGFEGQTRELARRLGVTQPLLFRYFPTKDHLIERVYQEVYLRRWSPHWEELLDDASLPLAERLKRFYHDYARAIFTYEWVRIFMFSGLKGVNINRRYLGLIRDRVLTRIVAGLRAEYGLPGLERGPPSERELELAWGLHGSVFYLGVRKWIYGVETPRDLDVVIDDKVDSFLAGAAAVLDARRDSRGRRRAPAANNIAIAK